MSDQSAPAQPEPSRADPIAFLRQADLLRNLPDRVLAELQQEFQPRHVAAGTVVCAEGDPGDELYFIVSGELETSAFINGTQARLGTMTAGDLFGEIAVLRRGNRTATVTAVTDTELLALPRAQLVQVVRRAPELGTALQELMRRRELRSRMRSLQ